MASTNGNDLIFFDGNVEQLTTTLTNAYSGMSVAVDDQKNVNRATYDGLGGIDTLSMTNMGDALFIRDADGNQTIRNVEHFQAGDGGDIVVLADATFLYGDVIIQGGAGDDILWSNAGNDAILASTGDDILDGGPGNDTLFGEEDNDHLYGGDGNDTLDGGSGNDYLAGGNGADTYVAGDGHDVIVETPDGGAHDVINLAAGVTLGDLTFSDSGNDLTITVGALGDITVVNQFVSSDYGIDELVFSNGSRFDLRSLPHNYAPVAKDDNVSGDEDHVITGNVLADNGNGADSDQNNDVLSVTPATINTDHGVVQLLGDGSFTYTPNADYNGADSFAYTVSDGHGGSDTGLVNIVVNSINDAPVAKDDNAGGDEDHVITGNVLADNGNGADSDIDGGTLSVVAAAITTVHNGVVNLLADGSFSYTPNANYNGMDSFAYTLLDGQGGSAVATVNLTINAVNDAPVAQNDEISGHENQQVAANVLADNGNGADSDIDGDSLSVTAATFTTANGGVVTIAANGDFTYTPASHYSGMDSFDYTLSDGHGGTAMGSVTLTLATDAIVGTNSGEVIHGTAGNDDIHGLGGDDVIYGGAGNDYIIGGDGDDTLYGGDNSPVVFYDKAFTGDVLFPNVMETINIHDLIPPGDPAVGIRAGDLTVDHATTATITREAIVSGYNNALGFFTVDADGHMQDARILWANVNDTAVGATKTVDLTGDGNGTSYGFFILANGYETNNHFSGMNVTADGVIKLVYDFGLSDAREATIHDDGNHVSVVYDDGIHETVLSGPAYYTTERGGDAGLNADDHTHVISGLINSNNTDVLRVGFEDLPSLGDADYQDVVFDVNVNPKAMDVSEPGNDTLIGGAGNDTLYGEAGDDILAIGQGADQVYGGAGHDTVVYTAMDNNVDVIHGFNTSEDVLNISNILDGFGPGDDIDNFVQLFNNVASGQTEVRVNADGDAGGAFTTIGAFDAIVNDTLDHLVASGAIVANQQVNV